MKNNFITLDEYIKNNTDSSMWEGIDLNPSYQFPIIKNIIEDWFKYRYISDNERFGFYFNRKFRIIQKQYEDLFRNETIEIDPFVTNYLERELDYDGTLNILRNIENDGTITNTTEGTSQRTPNITTETKGTGTITTTDTGTIENNGTSTTNSEFNNTSNTTNDESGSEHNKSLNGKLPMSSGYGTGGFPSSLNWQNASEQNETDETNTKKTTTNTTNGGTSEDSNTTDSIQTLDTENLQTRDTTTTTTSTGNEQTTQNSTSTNKNNGTQKETGEHTNKNNTKERMTGRSGILPSEILTKYRNYIYNTNSTEWVLNELEVCFLPTF